MKQQISDNQELLSVKEQNQVNIRTVQITHSLNSTHVSNACDTHGMNHTCMGFLDSTHMYVHAHAHAVYTYIYIYVYICACLYGYFS